MKRYINVQQLAEKLGVTRQSIYNWTKNGLPYVKIGSVKRFDVEAVQKWIDEQNK